MKLSHYRKKVEDQIVTQKSKVQVTTQAQKYLKNSFVKTYSQLSGHVFSYQILRNYFLLVVKCRSSGVIS